MTYFDVFNGDADGICALHQWRLVRPQESTLITGVKRDIALLQQVQASAGDQVLVLDISLDKNREALLCVLDAGASVDYFDHHFAGEIPQHICMTPHINTAADVCTSLLVNHYLNGKYLLWAITAAFGDNLFDAAIKAAEPLALETDQLKQLEQLGILINYNGYGVTESDLYFHPVDLYREIQPFDNPFDFISQSTSYAVLAQGYAADMAKAEQLPIKSDDESAALIMLPNEAWTRRVSGVYGNALARKYPNRAHALLTVMEDASYRISVRAPIINKTGADELCMQFPTGGGRKAAAGINALPVDMLDAFIDAFKRQYRKN
ncbi:MAG: acetyltransferase [Mariprofundaceae bacterium]|nr:acetyltransferase [Mariprofundaceae bacterium]